MASLLGAGACEAAGAAVATYAPRSFSVPTVKVQTHKAPVVKRRLRRNSLSVASQSGLRETPDPLELSSSVAYMIDQDTGEVYFEKNAYIKPEWLKPGAFCANISDNDYTFDAVKKMDRICYDSKKQFGIPVTMGLMKEAGLLNPDDCVQIGDVINGSVMAGQIAGLVKEVRSCKDIVESLNAQAEELLKGTKVYE